MIELIRECAPDFAKIQEAEIWHSGLQIGWHINILNDRGNALSGGCSESRETALRIAIAELVERKVFIDSQQTSLHELLLDEFPTSCGFAAGFEERPTIFRAIAESIERWCWSKWIDEGFKMELTARPEKLSPISEKFFASFSEVLFFELGIKGPKEVNGLPLRFSVALGVTDEGVFPGSRVCTLNEDPWQHALVEAWRHKVIATAPGPETIKSGFYAKRVLHFSKNKADAFDQIQKAQANQQWPTPALKLLKRVDSPTGTHVWRALCHDYKSWHLGPEPRFVY